MRKEKYYLFGVDEYANILEERYSTLEQLNRSLEATNWDVVRVIKGTEITIKKTVKAVEEDTL
jgi:hypothetical protein